MPKIEPPFRVFWALMILLTLAGGSLVYAALMTDYFLIVVIVWIVLCLAFLWWLSAIEPRDVTVDGVPGKELFIRSYVPFLFGPGETSIMVRPIYIAGSNIILDDVVIPMATAKLLKRKELPLFMRQFFRFGLQYPQDKTSYFSFLSKRHEKAFLAAFKPAKKFAG